MESTPGSYPFGVRTADENTLALESENPTLRGISEWPWESVSPSGVPPVAFRPYSLPRYMDRPGPYPYQSSSSSSREVSGPAAKVAIPRTTSASSQSQRRRSARACEPCRQRKIKCDGNKPVCRQCIDHNVSCFFVDVKRVRDQKQLGFLGKKVEYYEQLLQDLEREVDENAARRIRRALKASDPSSPTDDDGDSDSSTSSIGSLNALDLVEEDLNRSEKSVATGFFGKNSEVAWMQRLEDEAEYRSRRMDGSLEGEGEDEGEGEGKAGASSPPHHGSARQETAIAAMSYYLDDLSIPLMDSVDPYALPPKELANRFFTGYMESVHPSFNVVRKTAFVSQYRQFFSQPTKPPQRWLAILNMIFAIGCRYCQAVTGPGDGDYNDLVYLNRARLLTLGESVIFEHADLQQIQVEFLVALYFVSMCQINRAFKFSSMAFRSAVSLGINLRFVDDRTQYPAKEARSRLWWSIFLLEHLLTAITGRVSCVGESLSATPLPIPFEEEAFGRPEVLPLLQDSSLRMNRLKLTLLQTDEEARASASWLATCEPSPSLFFHCTVDLATITQAIINKVYSIQGLRDRASQVEQRIRKYCSILDIWVSKVPEAYRFTSGNSDHLDMPDNNHTPWMRERLSLAISYYSARITLCRPCLGHTSLQPGSLSPDPIPPSSLRRLARRNSRNRTHFSSDMALVCVISARSLLSTLPETPDIVWLTAVTPWWCILHYIMQATTAILLHLSSWPPGTASSEDPSRPAASDMLSMVRAVKKALRWLHHMARSYAASRRAFRQCHSVVRRIAPSLRLDISDLPDGRDLPVDGDESGLQDDDIDSYTGDLMEFDQVH
ncbi:fungal-specific transcription factor [Aspergillus sclerotioniger CBS 115572]|uniref:Fungal-specific transcription factor n=1 Tax=Aspergillus sclerotioniger CBS 115572 TaxID=1450535 RepID=A0A317VYR9_9EURO|nr:fungal-specific transcription factor [Aspergillus sclerotioniger CBS 115572]PWY78107.1 fungal-specific transcription factor [Aspergillus sclerotioniger CBS 115572]